MRILHVAFPVLLGGPQATRTTLRPTPHHHFSEKETETGLGVHWGHGGARGLRVWTPGVFTHLFRLQGPPPGCGRKGGVRRMAENSSDPPNPEMEGSGKLDPFWACSPPSCLCPHTDLTSATWWPGGGEGASEMGLGGRGRGLDVVVQVLGLQLLLAADYLLSWERGGQERQVSAGQL